MGHDILAGKNFDAERLTEHLARPAWTTKEWEHRLDDYPHCAHLRRSAYDPFGKVIYRALGAEDMYGGPSGVGETESFTRVNIKTALQLLPGIVADQAPAIDTTIVEEMAEMLGAEDTSRPDNSELPDIADEQEFLMEVLNWMDTNKEDTVEVYFG